MPKEKVRTLPASCGDPLINEIVPDGSFDSADMDQTPPKEEVAYSNVADTMGNVFQLHPDTVHMDQERPVERIPLPGTAEADTGPGLKAEHAGELEKLQGRYP